MSIDPTWATRLVSNDLYDAFEAVSDIVEQVDAAQKAGSRAIVLRSGLRHFSAGADLDIFEKRVATDGGGQGGDNRRLNGVEFLKFM